MKACKVGASSRHPTTASSLSHPALAGGRTDGKQMIAPPMLWFYAADNTENRVKQSLQITLKHKKHHG